eukprot:2672139-Prymnesium_polylepis.1
MSGERARCALERRPGGPRGAALDGYFVHGGTGRDDAGFYRAAARRPGSANLRAGVPRWLYRRRLYAAVFAAFEGRDSDMPQRLRGPPYICTRGA